jgi:enamine deaminase RidA (YjgF/YER057c/UK114 family)
MKKKVTMTCILKSGAVVEDTVKIDKKNKQVFRVINEMRKDIENSLDCEEPAVSNITFGKLTVAVSEIAAIKFKEY